MEIPKERNIPTQVDFFDGKKIIQIVCGIIVWIDY
jgi:hypothetical protein